MSTPRKRWFRTADAILREPWPREQKLTLVLLMAWLNTRWARDGIPHAEAGNALLSSGVVEEITGRKRLLSGFGALRELSQSVSFSVSLENDYVRISWPKFPKYQQLGSRSRGSDGLIDEPSHGPPPTPAPSSSSKTQKKRPARAEGGRKKAATGTPASLSIAAYCEEFEAARQLKAAPSPMDCRKLRELVEQFDLTPDRVRAAAKVFFATGDDWVKQMSYSLVAFVARFQQCDVRAQKRGPLPIEGAEPPAPETDDQPRLMALFTGGNGLG